MCEKVIEIGKRGDTIASMAIGIGISRDTMHEWRQSNPTFSDAVTKGMQYAQEWWERKGREHTFGKAQVNAQMFSLNVRNRFPADWKDKREYAADPDASVVNKITIEVVKALPEPTEGEIIDAVAVKVGEK